MPWHCGLLLPRNLGERRGISNEGKTIEKTIEGTTTREEGKAKAEAVGGGDDLGAQVPNWVAGDVGTCRQCYQG